MQPDALRPDVASRLRRLADLIEADLPANLDIRVPYSWAAITTLLMARLAGLARTSATLIEAGHDLDGQMVMRSMFEHGLLLAWLSIDPDDEVEGPAGRGREARTRWWSADQLRREQGLYGKHQVQLGSLSAPIPREQIKKVKQVFKDELGWGELPRLQAMAEETDSYWAPRLAGWPNAEPGDQDYPLTQRGFYLILHQLGNWSVHPSLQALTARFVTDQEGTGIGELHPEAAEDGADAVLAITAYLLLYAISVMRETAGWPDLDEALRVLDRFDVVRGPDLLLEQLVAVLDGRQGAVRGVSDAGAVEVSHYEGLTAVRVGEPGSQLIVAHLPGPIWTVEQEGGPARVAGPRELDQIVTELTRVREILAKTVWNDPTSRATASKA